MSAKKSKRDLVVGLGASGRAAARFLARRGRRVVAVDESVSEALESISRELGEMGVETRLGTSDWPTDVDRVVVGPGVPIAKLEEHRRLRIPILGELELGCREVDVPIVAVTGTNGKSTVVTNIVKGLVSAGCRAEAAGNLGLPVTEWVDSGREVDRLVLEVSSYQLETVSKFHPHIAVVLNIAPDHLGRHGTLEDYLAAKSRITENQTIDDALLLHRSLEAVPAVQKTRARLYWAGREVPPSAEGLSLNRDGLTWRAAGVEWSRSVSLDSLFAHEIENLVVTAAVLHLAGLDPDDSARAFENPIRLPHRIEPVGIVQDVRYINDSKATNVHAAVAALKSVPGPVVWLVGGRAKGEDLSPLVETAAEIRVALAVCFGEDRRIFEAALKPRIRVKTASTLAEACELAAGAANRGDTVLLSPAAASFDEFVSFEDRGDRFKDWVERLRENAA